MPDTSYFKDKITQLKAYILGLIINNVDEYRTGYICTSFSSSYLKDQKTICDNLLQFTRQTPGNGGEEKYETVSTDFVNDIFGLVNDGEEMKSQYDGSHSKNKLVDIDISKFVQKQPKEIANQYLTAYFEKHAVVKNNCIIITDKDYKQNLETFSNFYNIPCDKENDCIIYSGSNALDVFGAIYVNANYIYNKNFHNIMIKSLDLEAPVLKMKKIHNDAITPIKANFSDVGYDLIAIGISKQINKNTILCNTGIKLDIPPNYYVEIAPRSSIMKSGYMLANSIGIIDCSYKGELLIALTKVDDTAPEISFPFRCCQLIMKKQIFAIMLEVDDVSESKRGEGGFGSSG